MSEYSHHIFKIITVGDYAVGKTSLLKRYLADVFNNTYKATLGVDIFPKQVILKDKKVVFNFNFWDIAGQKLFLKVRNKFYEGTDGAFLCFDCTRKDSFESLIKWNEEIPQDIKFKILISNKIDLKKERIIPNKKGIEMAKNLKIPIYGEISAKENSGVKEIFQKMLTSCFMSLYSI